MAVESTHGLGFIRQSTRRYKPERDLAKLAIRLADALDADGTYRTTDLYLADLPEVWFKASTTLETCLTVTRCAPHRRCSRLR